MRLVVAIVWLVIGLAVTTFAQQNNTVDPQTAQQIRALAMKYDEAFNRNDAAAVAALYTEDGVHAFKQISHGRPAIEKFVWNRFPGLASQQPCHYGRSVKGGRQ